MRARVLEPHEWDRIAETGLDYAVWRALDPATTRIVIVEDARGAIVATWGTFAVQHVEGFWVHPAHRARGGVLRRLCVGMRALLTSLQVTGVATQAETPEVATLLVHAGATPLPGQSFVLPTDFGPWRQE